MASDGIMLKYIFLSLDKKFFALAKEDSDKYLEGVMEVFERTRLVLWLLFYLMRYFFFVEKSFD